MCIKKWNVAHTNIIFRMCHSENAAINCWMMKLFLWKFIASNSSSSSASTQMCRICNTRIHKHIPLWKLLLCFKVASLVGVFLLAQEFYRRMKQMEMCHIMSSAPSLCISKYGRRWWRYAATCWNMLKSSADMHRHKHIPPWKRDTTFSNGRNFSDGKNC